MQNWALHHMHFVVLLDVLIHGGMIGVLVSIWVAFGKMTKLPKPPESAGRLTFLLFVMGGIIGMFTLIAVNSFYSCATNYAEWWSR